MPRAKRLKVKATRYYDHWRAGVFKEGQVKEIRVMDYEQIERDHEGLLVPYDEANEPTEPTEPTDPADPDAPELELTDDGKAVGESPENKSVEASPEDK